MRSSDGEPVISGPAAGSTTPMRTFGRVSAECVLGGMFFGGAFGAAVGVVVGVVGAADLGTDGLKAVATSLAFGAPTFGFIGCIVGIVLGLGYGLAVGVGTGAAMAAMTGNSRSRLAGSQLRLVAGLSAALSVVIGFASFILISGSDDDEPPSLTEDRGLILLVLVVFILGPGAVAAGFAAWRTSGWTPRVEDVISP